VQKFLTFIARFIAAILSIFFVITTLLAIVLTTVNHLMVNAGPVKKALAEQDIYARLPEIVGAALTSNSLRDPCAGNLLACSIDGASPELQACLTNALGLAAYQEIGSSQRIPTDSELQLAQPCLDQFGTPGTDDSLSGTEGSSDGSGMPPFFQKLTAQDWQAILSILLPPQELRTMTDGVLDQLFAYLNGGADSVFVPLHELKIRLSGDAGTDLINLLINAQPSCTLLELNLISGPSTQDSFILCLPTELLFPILESQLRGQLNSAVASIPEKAFLIKPPSSPAALPPGGGPFGADPISTIRIVRLIMRLSPLLPLLFLLGIALFAVRSLKGWMRWWGIPIVVSGVIALGLGLFTSPAMRVAWNIFIFPRIPPYLPIELVGIFRDILLSIIRTVSGWIILEASILLAFGLAAWIGSIFIKTRPGPDMPEGSTAAAP
jgi:hypothetical protein